jgi:hypothetical protein
VPVFIASVPMSRRTPAAWNPATSFWSIACRARMPGAADPGRRAV